MRVKAIQVGYYEHSLRQVDSEFVIKDESELGSWMEQIEEVEAPRVSAPVAKPKGFAKKAEKETRPNEDVI